MASYKEIKAGCPSRKRYADGGSVTKEKRGSKTIVNVITTQPAAGGMPAPVAPPVAPMGNSPSPAGSPVPPEAAAMALGTMQGKPGAPGAFRDGGKVAPIPARGGADSGVGRKKQATRAAKIPAQAGSFKNGGRLEPSISIMKAERARPNQSLKNGGKAKK